jgi:hypothetical protein
MVKDSTGKPVLAGIATIINELVADSIIKPEVEVKDKKEPVAEVETLPTPDYNKAATMATSIKGGAFDLVVYEKVHRHQQSILSTACLAFALLSC